MFDVGVLTVLMRACISHDVRAVRVLIDAGADVNARPEKGPHVLKVAKEMGTPEIVDALVRAGAKE